MNLDFLQFHFISAKIYISQYTIFYFFFDVINFSYALFLYFIFRCYGRFVLVLNETISPACSCCRASPLASWIILYQRSSLYFLLNYQLDDGFKFNTRMHLNACLLFIMVTKKFNIMGPIRILLVSKVAWLFKAIFYYWNKILTTHDICMFNAPLNCYLKYPRLVRHVVDGHLLRGHLLSGHLLRPGGEVGRSRFNGLI